MSKDSDNLTIRQMLGNIEGKVDMILELRQECLGVHENLSGRVQKIEQQRSWLFGAAAVVGSVLTLAGSFIWESIKRSITGQ